jgi:hypothetical protein
VDWFLRTPFSPSVDPRSIFPCLNIFSSVHVAFAFYISNKSSTLQTPFVSQISVLGGLFLPDALPVYPLPRRT